MKLHEIIRDAYAILKQKNCGEMTFEPSDPGRNTFDLYFAKFIAILKDKGGYLGEYVSDDEIKAIVKCMLPDIIAYFESEEGQRAFAEWKKEQEDKQQRLQSEKAS